MGWLGFLAVACLAGAMRPPALVDLADRARAQPAEFAADALLRIADAPTLTDVSWKREILEDAFHLAAGAQQPYARRNRTGSPGSLFDKAYSQGLDACTLQCKAVHAMLAIDYKKARKLFGEIPPVRIPRLSCDDPLTYDVSIFYDTAGEVAARAFTAKEVAAEEPFHLLLRYATDVTSPAQVAPIARMLAGASLKPAQVEALKGSFAGASQQLSGSPCADSAKLEQRPAGQCESPQCRQLATQFTGLAMAPNGFGLSPEQKATSEWGGKLRQYLAALADWRGDDDPVEYFQFKSRFYGELFNVAPNGPERDLLLSTLLGWLQQNGYQRDHRVEWFYPVNALIIQAFADPAGMKTTIRELRRSADPVIALYVQLEELLPRPIEGTIGLL